MWSGEDTSMKWAFLSHLATNHGAPVAVLAGMHFPFQIISLKSYLSHVKLLHRSLKPLVTGNFPMFLHCGCRTLIRSVHSSLTRAVSSQVLKRNMGGGLSPLWTGQSCIKSKIYVGESPCIYSIFMRSCCNKDSGEFYLVSSATAKGSLILGICT